mmetsp:Transcript_3660/g.6981  ORF Transcript_3660/g.6981 Transcript_3660/m.6981 type:complete len:120 (-) Transcript_3660:2142-2501(-)
MKILPKDPRHCQCHSLFLRRLGLFLGNSVVTARHLGLLVQSPCSSPPPLTSHATRTISLLSRNPQYKTPIPKSRSPRGACLRDEDTTSTQQARAMHAAWMVGSIWNLMRDRFARICLYM